ncbi:MAG: SHOCT domain-containing protein [Chloroflexota bacterium]|nr:MAG: SHOCT domain-containing protein [Chloroflexota bacterium]
MMGYEGYSWLGGMGGFGVAGGLLFMVGLVALLVWGTRALLDGRSATGVTPAEILRRRFATGEINQVEYEQARKTLA